MQILRDCKFRFCAPHIYTHETIRSLFPLFAGVLNLGVAPDAGVANHLHCVGTKARDNETKPQNVLLKRLPSTE